MFYVCIAFAVIVPFLIGSISPTVLLPQKLGGKGRWLLALILDVAKTLGAVLAVREFAFVMEDHIHEWVVWVTGDGCYSLTFLQERFFEWSYLFMWIAALTATIGNRVPIWHKFKHGAKLLNAILPAIAAMACPVIFLLLEDYQGRYNYDALDLNLTALFFGVIISLIVLLAHKNNILDFIIAKAESKSEDETQ